MDFDSRLSSRLAVVEALGSLRATAWARAKLEERAAAIEHAVDGLSARHETDDAESISPSPDRTAYEAYALLALAVAHLARWADAVRGATVDADRFQRAARVAAADAKSLVNAASQDQLLAPTRNGLTAAADAIASVSNVDELASVAETVLTVTLPLPLEDGRRRRGLRVPPRREVAPAEAESAKPEPARPVAFLTFWINDVIVADPQRIQPDVLYDLRLQVQLSRWPAAWAAVEFVPLHVEPSGTLTAPVFRFDASDVGRADDPQAADAPLTVSRVGRLRVHAPMDLLARPLEIRYVAQGVECSGANVAAPLGNVEAAVQGQTRLRLQSYDPALNPITGFRAIDPRIMELRDAVRREGVPDAELRDFLTLLAAVGSIAAQALADDLYGGTWSEDEFQRDVRQRLRAIPTIGGELDEHPHVAGGITDLSFRKIRLELKVQGNPPATLGQVRDHYGQQTAQYVVGSDRRCGVLVVLDTTPKANAPNDVGNDVDVAVLPAPHGGARSVILGLVIVRGNLPRPSDLSRRAR